MIIDKLNALVGKEFDEKNYHCYHFVQEVLGLPSLDEIAVGTASSDIIKYQDIFTEIYDPCPDSIYIVLLGESHIGISYEHYYIFHNSVHGVRCETKGAILRKYKTIKYYRYRGVRT